MVVSYNDKNVHTLNRWLRLLSCAAFCRCGGLDGVSERTSNPVIPNLPVLAFSLWCDLLLTRSHHAPLYCLYRSNALTQVLK